jgi:hypothetical protein
MGKTPESGEEVGSSSRGQWSEEEVSQIGRLVRSADPSDGIGDFVDDHDWRVLSVTRHPESFSIVDVILSRVEDERRLTLSLVADQLNQKPWVPNESSLTDQVWLLSIQLMEYVHIVGIDGFEDDDRLEFPLTGDVYSLRRPSSEDK